jgi:glutathione S-transferase
MTLHLHYHPLASYCWKVLIALYETGAPFEPHIVDLGDEASRAAFARLWPIAKMPVLHDDGRDATVAETSIIIEYLARHSPGPTRLLPVDPGQALRVRFLDRVFDHYVMDQMSKVVTDKIRPEGQNDAFGVEQARALLATACGYVEQQLPADGWAVGEAFTLADCAAAPALFYADKVQPLGDAHPKTAAYLERLRRRPSFARVLEEAQPYFAMFPG